MTAYDLAAKFADELCRELTEEQLDQVLERNAAETNPNICHSHDFCDANDVMISALLAFDLEYDPQNQEQATLIGLAWQIAKDEEFHVESIRNFEQLGE